MAHTSVGGTFALKQVRNTYMNHSAGRREATRIAGIFLSFSSIQSFGSGVLLAIFLGLYCGSGSAAYAQGWKVKTPRDTVRVPATAPYWTYGNFPFNSNVLVNLKIIGTFGLWPGQDSSGFDARYTIDIPGWTAPFPLIDPPTFNGKSYDILFQISTNSGLSDSIIRVDQPDYQPTHIYTSQYLSGGVRFGFHIDDRMELDSAGRHGYYYATGSGALYVQLSQFTPAEVIQHDSLEFGTVLIGQSSYQLDSIESYGVDGLEVDSVRVKGSSDFSFQSQLGDHFTLSTETTNQFTVDFSPGQKYDEYAEMFIYSHNADGPDRVRVIYLHGIGGSPSIAIGPHQIDFGKVRVNTTATRPVDVYNGGNAPLYVTGDPILYDTTGAITPTPSVVATVPVTPGQNWPIAIHFLPMMRKRYAATMYVQAQGQPLDSVTITGQGVAPIPVLNKSSINFGNVRRGDSHADSVTLTNIGDLTATAVGASIGGQNFSAFKLTPSGSFLLNPDSTRVFTIVFSPGTGPEGVRQAYLKIDYDDNTYQYVTLVGYEIEPKLLLGRTLIDFGKVRVGYRKVDTLSIINNSNVILPLDPPPFTEPIPEPFLVLTPPTSLGPNQSSSLNVQFSPQQHGYWAAWLRTSANGQHDSAYVIGFGGIPKPALSLDTLDFGILPAGVTSTKYTILSDTGDFPVNVAYLRIVGPNASDFQFSNGTPTGFFTVPDSAQQTIDVQFVTNARTGLLHQAYIVVTYDDSTRDTVVMLAREQSQYVQFASRVLDFGKVRVKTQSLPLEAVFSNGSNEQLTVGGINVTQLNPYFWPGDTTSTVRPEDTAQVPIYFLPLKKGSFQGYLHASAGSIRPDSVLLEGIGAAPVPSFSAKLVDCGAVKLGQIAPAQALTLKNIGDWQMITSFKIVNDLHNEFGIQGMSGLTTDTIAFGDSLIYAITFKPTVPELVHTADLVFTYDDSTTDTVKLVGEDIYGFLVVDSSAVHFGKVRVLANANETVHLINTSTRTLSAGSVQLASSSGSFTSNPGGALNVNSRTAQPITISFAPKTRGLFTDTLFAVGGDMQNDTLAISGQGVAPVPQFSKSSLDFGALYIGDIGTQNAFVTDTGDWDLIVTGVSVRGPNLNDFTPTATLPASFMLKPGDTMFFNVDFSATTPIQATPRTADLIFTEDDGTTFYLPLTELDKAPATTEIGFDNFLVRPGDAVYDDLWVKNAIPVSANLHEVSGTFTFDTRVAQLQTIGRGTLDTNSNWTVTHKETTAGNLESVFYDIKDTTDTLSGAGSLLRLKFAANPTAGVGAKTDVKHVSFQFFNTKEITPQTVTGVIVIDSTCGATHLEVGAALASFVQQNSPNPFGGTNGNGTTSIPFDVGPDNTPVTIRILDVTGREIMRPLDNQVFRSGHYSVIVPSHALGSGIFFYEFQAGSCKPEVKKMIVTE